MVVGRGREAYVKFVVVAAKAVEEKVSIDLDSSLMR